MIKFGVCNEMFEGWKIEDVFQFASQTGYHGVEIAPFTLADSVEEISSSQRRRIREEALRSGLEIIGLHWLLVKPEGLYINHPQEEIREKTSQYLQELIKFCHDLGGRIMVIGSPHQRNILPGISYQEAWELAKKTLLECLPLAEEKNVYLCWEPLSPKETNFINTSQEAVKLIKEINHLHLRLILDVKAMSSEKKTYSEIIREGSEYLFHFHANDDNGLGPGFGKADYKEIAQTLKAINYSGYLSVEVFDFSLGAEYIARKSLENLRNYFKEENS